MGSHGKDVSLDQRIVRRRVRLSEDDAVGFSIGEVGVVALADSSEPRDSTYGVITDKKSNKNNDIRLRYLTLAGSFFCYATICCSRNYNY